MYRLYDDPISGNGYKVRLVLAQLHIAYQYHTLDIMKGETRQPTFLTKNPLGKIPVLETPDGRFLSESNAILWYLARGRSFGPATPDEEYETLRWMFFEQYSHEPHIGVARFWHHLPAMSELQRKLLPERLEKGHQALAIMEQHLTGADYLVGNRYGIADIALYAYSHVAEEGGFDLSGYPALGAWLKRVARQPNHVTITDVPAAAGTAA